MTFYRKLVIINSRNAIKRHGFSAIVAELCGDMDTVVFNKEWEDILAEARRFMPANEQLAHILSLLAFAHIGREDAVAEGRLQWRVAFSLVQRAFTLRDSCLLAFPDLPPQTEVNLLAEIWGGGVGPSLPYGFWRDWKRRKDAQTLWTARRKRALEIQAFLRSLDEWPWDDEVSGIIAWVLEALPAPEMP